MSTAVSAKTLGFKQITVGELHLADHFSVDGKRFFIFSSVENIGVGLVSIHYLSMRMWRSFDRVIKENQKVFVAPIGRHYQAQ